MGWNPDAGGGVAGVASFEGRTGVVVSANGDYTASQITDGVSTLGGATVLLSLDNADTTIGAAQADATQALADSATAQGDATQALADASAAQADATQALSDASAANTNANTRLVKSPNDATLYGQIFGTNTAITSANVPDATAGFGATITASLSTLNTTKAPLAGPTFTDAVSMSGAASVSVPTVTPATDSDTSAASTAFVQSAIVSAADPFRRQVLVDNFAAGLFASALGWIGSTNGAGAIATSNSAVVTGSDGHRTLNPGANATGRSAMSFESIAGQLPYVTPWSRGKFIKEWRVQVSSIADDFELSVSLGAGALTNSTSLVSGLGAVYTNATGVWTLVSRSAGVTVATQASATALAANTWVYVRIELEGASARLYVGATKAAAGTTPVATITTVGASVLALGPMAKITNIGGVNTARNFIVGLYAEDFTLTTPV